MRVQLLLKLLGDNVQTRELVLALKPVEMFRIMSPKEIIPHDSFTVTHGMRLLALKESSQPALPELKALVLHELVRAPPENSQNAATRLVRVNRAQLVNRVPILGSRNAIFPGNSWTLRTSRALSLRLRKWSLLPRRISCLLRHSR